MDRFEIALKKPVKLRKRKWHYVQKPYEYEIECDKCGGRNIEWSEFEKCIYCYDCGIDTKGTEGVFGGPIPIGAAAVLGMSFDRWDMKNERILTYDQKLQKYIPKKVSNKK